MGVAIQGLELDDRDCLVRGPIVVRAFPPAFGLWIDDVAIDVDVRNAGAIADARRSEALLRKTDRFDDFLHVRSRLLPGCAVGVRGGDEYVLCGNPEFAFNLLRHVLPDLLGNPACIQRDESGAGRTAVDHDGAGIEVIENAFVVPGKCVLRR